MNDPFLIDECLAPDLVALAHARGHSATHIVFRELQGTPDHRLVPIIQRESFVLVTNKGRDFLRLYRQEKMHPGLIIIVPGGIDTDDQLRLFGRALDLIEPMQDLLNKVVEVQLDGSVQVRDWPEPGSNT